MIYTQCYSWVKMWPLLSQAPTLQCTIDVLCRRKQCVFHVQCTDITVLSVHSCMCTAACALLLYVSAGTATCMQQGMAS